MWSTPLGFLKAVETLALQGHAQTAASAAEAVWQQVRFALEQVEELGGSTLVFVGSLYWLIVSDMFQPICA